MRLPEWLTEGVTAEPGRSSLLLWSSAASGSVNLHRLAHRWSFTSSQSAALQGQIWIFFSSSGAQWSFHYLSPCWYWYSLSDSQGICDICSLPEPWTHEVTADSSSNSWLFLESTSPKLIFTQTVIPVLKTPMADVSVLWHRQPLSIIITLYSLVIEILSEGEAEVLTKYVIIYSARQWN